MDTGLDLAHPVATGARRQFLTRSWRADLAARGDRWRATKSAGRGRDSVEMTELSPTRHCHMWRCMSQETTSWMVSLRTALSAVLINTILRRSPVVGLRRR